MSERVEGAECKRHSGLQPIACSECLSDAEANFRRLQQEAAALRKEMDRLFVEQTITKAASLRSKAALRQICSTYADTGGGAITEADARAIQVQEIMDLATAALEAK